jgi:SAM-dependent methyltransferase
VKPQSTEDILELMQGYLISAALGAAMELGLFWLLASKPLPAEEVATSLSIPLNRCQHWLQILCQFDLLEDGPDGYAPSKVAREAILDAQSQESWAFQALEERGSAVFVRDLALNIGRPMAEWPTPIQPPPDYFRRVMEDPGFAARFTRKLYEIHLRLADHLAGMLDLRGVRSLLDLGGGSGVVSLALLRKNPDLTSVVVDVENVCRAGREIAVENCLEGRITYLAADLLRDDLPSGFDMVLLCDLGFTSDTIFRKAHAALKPVGRLVMVEKFAPNKTSPPPSRLLSAFIGALENPGQTNDFTTVEDAQTQLRQSGFGDFKVSSVPHEDDLLWNLDWTLLQARKQGPAT